MPPRKAIQATDAVAEEHKLIELTSPEKGDAVERVELFSIDGKVYTVPKALSPTVGLRYVHIARKQGQEMAADYLLETMLGEEAYEALMDFSGLNEDVLEIVLEACSNIALAASRPK